MVKTDNLPTVNLCMENMILSIDATCHFPPPHSQQGHFFLKDKYLIQTEILANFSF